MTHEQEQLIIDLLEADIEKHSGDPNVLNPTIQAWSEQRVDDARETLEEFRANLCNICDGTGVTDGFGGNGKTSCHKCEPKIVKRTSPKLDDKAYALAEFIQKLGKVQDDQFEELYEEAQMKGWFEGFGVDENGSCVARGWLFDYCFNDNSELFSEYCGSVEYIFSP